MQSVKNNPKKMKKFPSISFFCPAYNDEKNIEKVVKRADALLKRYAEVYEILVVNDGSPDKTANVLKKLKKKYSRLRIITHKKNQGYGAALRDGFENSRYELVMYTDGDFQYNPLQFSRLLKFIDNYDLVIGYKIHRNDSTYRYIQSKIFNIFISVMFGLGFKDINCSMKIIRKKILDNIKIETDTAFIDVEIVFKAKRLGAKIKEVGVDHMPRLHGEAGGVKFRVIWPTIRDMTKFFFRRITGSNGQR